MNIQDPKTQEPQAQEPMPNKPAPGVGGTALPPTSLVRDLLRYILGFSVSVGVGLAPYLGKVDVPLFDSLLELIPLNIQDTALPLSAALMGIVAVVIQWYGSSHVSKKWLQKWFVRTLITTLVSFVILFVMHTLLVVKVNIHGGESSVSYLVGFSRPVRPPCTAEISDSACISQKLTLNPADVESFWGSGQVRIAKLALVSPYLVFTSTFGLLVGLLLLRSRMGQMTR
jgi:hypothetical protein